MGGSYFSGACSGEGVTTFGVYPELYSRFIGNWCEEFGVQLQLSGGFASLRSSGRLACGDRLERYLWLGVLNTD